MTAREIFLDYFGRADGPSSGGKNLAGHWAKRELNLMSMSGSVATQIPHAVGSALAARAARRGQRQRGVLWRRRLVEVRLPRRTQLRGGPPATGRAVLREQRHGDLGAVRDAVGVRSVADRAVGYAVVGISVDGSDPLQVYRVMREAVDGARAGKGPALIEARVTRLGPAHQPGRRDARHAR